MAEGMPSEAEQENMMKKLEIFKIQGTDRRGRPILRIIGNLFPARLVGVKTLNKYLEQEIYPALEAGPFSVVYFHTRVSRACNFPGISALKSLYDAVPPRVLANMDALYFLHPGIQSRLFVATVGRLLFSGVYGKVKYVNRLEFLWDKVKRREMEVPDFVQEYDEEMMESQSRPIVDYGMESDHPRMVCTAAHILDSSSLSTYSTRCIA